MTLYDRSEETKTISSLLLSHQVSSIILTGRSGVGKSAIASECIKRHSLTERVYSFKNQMPLVGKTLSQFFVSLSQEFRPSFIKKFTNARFKDIKIGYGGVGATFEVLPDSIDGNFFSHLFETLKFHRIGVVRIQNLELCQDKEDLNIIKILSEAAAWSVKIIFEIGTLDTPSAFVSHMSKKHFHGKVVEITPLGEAKTMGMYRHLHLSEPPPDIYKRTKGLPLAIEHQASIENDDLSLQWVEEKVRSLNSGEYQLVYMIALIGEPAPIVDLKQICIESTFQTDIISLARKGVIEDDGKCINFKHPSFSLSVRKAASVYTDREANSRLLKWHKDDFGSADANYLGKSRIAVRAGDHEFASLCALSGLKEAYTAQDGLAQMEFCNIILNSWEKLGEPSSLRKAMPVVVFAKIQASCLLMEPDTAEKCLGTHEKFVSYDKRINILKALILAQRSQLNESNRLIDSILSNLDDRSTVVALAIRIANDIPLENAQRARESLLEALSIAQRHGFADLEEELIRLHAKLEPFPEVAVLKMKDFILKKGVNWHSKISLARLRQNIAVQELLLGNINAAMDGLLEARTAFEQYGLSFAAYSAVCQSVGLAYQGLYQEAIPMLIDAQCLCRERYDLFSVLNNLACCQALIGETDEARLTLKRAEDILQRDDAPKEDNILVSVLRQNMTLLALRNGEIDLARKEIEKIPPTKFSHFQDLRASRLERLVTAVKEGNSNYPLEKENYSIKGWMYDRFNVNFIVLSFFDFPFSILDPNEISSCIVAQH